MATLKIAVRFQKDGEERVLHAEFPYKTGKYEFPKAFPFTISEYLGPDYGYSLGWIAIDAEQGLLTLAYADNVRLDEQGKASFRNMSKTAGPIDFEFAVE